MYKPEEHLALVQSVLNIYYSGGHAVAKRMGIDVSDLHQIGSIGLIKACEDYDAKKAKFVTYAFIKIHGEILRSIRDDHYMAKYSKQIRQLAFVARKLDDLSPMNIANQMSIPYGLALDVHFYLHRGMWSLFEPTNKQAGPEIDLERIDVIAAEEATTEDKALRQVELKERLSLLNSTEYKVIAMLLKGHTQVQVAAKLGVSQKHVNRLRDKSIKKIQDLYVVS
jgi:RNA polymerase sigma factor (sigma-70 family)